MAAEGCHYHVSDHHFSDPVLLAQRLLELATAKRKLDFASLNPDELWNVLHHLIERQNSSTGLLTPTYPDAMHLVVEEPNRIDHQTSLVTQTEETQHPGSALLSDFSDEAWKSSFIEPNNLPTTVVDSDRQGARATNLSNTMRYSRPDMQQGSLSPWNGSSVDPLVCSSASSIPERTMGYNDNSPSLTASTANSIPAAEQQPRPFSVAVKLFVNRIPKWMTNDQLRAIFTPFGHVTECNILKNSRGPKGCAFVKYASIVDAYKAILHLHGKCILNEETGPVQIKYADGEIDRLGLSADVQPGGESVKVFVGCLPKSCTEETLYELFSKFGRVDEVFVLRDANRQSKRSAFVTFPRMSMALDAIHALDRHHVLPNARRPLEVRLAQSKASRNRTLRSSMASSRSIDVSQTQTLKGSYCTRQSLPVDQSERRLPSQRSTESHYVSNYPPSTFLLPSSTTIHTPTPLYGRDLAKVQRAPSMHTDFDALFQIANVSA